ncbi:MAG: ATP-binding protein [Bacteroidota bacterium]
MITIFINAMADHPTLMGLIFFGSVAGFLSQGRTRLVSFDDYAVAGRSLPTSVLVMTLLATFIGAGELYLSNIIVEYKLPFVIVHILFMLFSFWAIGTFLAPRLIYFRNSVTMGDLMREFYGFWGQLLMGVVGVVVSLFVAVTQIRSIGILSFSLLGLNPYLAIVLFGGILVAYSAWGGMRAVSYTDVFQVLLVFGVLAVLARWLLVKTDGLEGMLKYFSNESAGKLRVQELQNFKEPIIKLCFWHLSFTFSLTLPIFHRMLMVSSKRQVREMWYVSAMFYGVFFFFLIVVSFGGYILSEGKLSVKEGESMLLKILQYLFEGNSWRKDVVCASFLGVLFSTADSFLHAVGITMLRDVLGPLKVWMSGSGFAEESKALIARMLVGGMGLFSLIMALFGYYFNNSLWDMPLYAGAVVLYGLVLWPLLIGICGVKTDRLSFLNYCLCYVVFTVAFSYAKWEKTDYFWMVVVASLIAYFLTHLIVHRGFAVLNRSRYTTSESLWMSLSQFSLKDWLGGMRQLPAWARYRLLTCPAPSAFRFSSFLFVLYTLECVLGSENGHLLHIVSGVRGVSLLLCLVLLFEWTWPKSWKPYHALYWLFTLFYCVPFSATLVFFHKHESMLAMLHWIGMFVFLLCLVDTFLFFVLGGSGVVLATVAWYVVGKGFVPYTLGTTGWMGVYEIVLLFALVAVFKGKKDKDMLEKLYWNRITTNNLMQEMSDPLHMLQGMGNILRTAFAQGHETTDSQGRDGFFINKRQYRFLDRFSTHIIERSREAQEDLRHFTKFIEQQILGIFVEQSVSMYGFVKEGIRRVSSQYLEKLDIRFSCPKDFKAKVLSSVFPNVIASLISNAYHHGYASVVEVTVDGEQRKISIRDNGEGIPPEIFRYIFDLHYTESRRHKVGLAFTRMVIEASGGKVFCYSKYKGKDSFTEFVIELP